MEVPKEGTLEERLTAMKIPLKEPEKDGYKYGDLWSSGSSKRDAEDKFVSQIAVLRVTNVINIRYEVEGNVNKVGATVYRLA